ncbi:RXT2-lik [Niveomyces insectorum RCEF 264]|uniref:RXT2-lik n=1 Tax=Niveomyces insectorum RCEF 264 TaxID=1081102 RepID=A0A167XP25_9HYPO|nr:RXT2-lik [Niveomyces insectorum RCEF 264]
MAARDQALFLDTYLGLRRALKRKSYDSDSDSSIDQPTNRGNKLKKRARFVRAGQLGGADGLSVLSEPYEYDGYRREILSHNPPLVDDDGYEVDSEEDDDEVVQEAEANAADLNPYAGIRLENLLAPLTAVTDLPAHPTLSRPFTSSALSELATQGCNWMHKENAALWEVKPLLAKFCGDHIWVDCALLVTPNDADLFDDGFVARLAAARTKGSRGSNGSSENGLARIEDAPRTSNGSHNGGGGAADAHDTDMPDIDEHADERRAGKATNGRSGHSRRPADVDGAVAAAAAAPQTNGQHGPAGEGSSDDVNNEGSNYGDRGRGENDEDNHNEDNEDNDDHDDHDDDALVHPLFLAPRSAQPDPNLGLPEAEAEDVRRLLQLWVQKQEEVARGTKKLHEGLLRADRLRTTVFMWSKAEAHRDLSDGEDWYDREAWGLAEDLKKGHDEEEEDQQLPHKKTRNRK